eukprot:Lithocolla_globosa_v1_NODE_3790_length_1578_cov_14.719632.p3 type:complete len:109 gc:universal NODE_3790_length_1578_cov_14.719632:1181-1507(+)
MASHVLDFHFQLLLSALLGSLKGKVLQEVSNTVVLGSLVPRTSINPDADGRRLASHNGLRCNSQSTVERGHISCWGPQNIVRKLGSRCCGKRASCDRWLVCQLANSNS